MREDQIAEVWLVRKPTRDGMVTSVELYDTARQQIAMIFVKRKPGQPENAEWRRILRTVRDVA